MEVFSHLEINGIKSIRQVCRAFNLTASRFLLSRVYISTQSKDLEVLLAISEHGAFANQVKEIVYYAPHFTSVNIDQYL